ncbi:MAG: hypothetical protein EA424_27235 [Planctomycetaceae bacterium]|nr:MAG: hypothetical protein EA424_27235 [Planctomycetaceae bacterium]
MRKPVLQLALIVCLGHSAQAQDDPKPAAALPNASTGGESYLVQLSEFRIKDSSHAGWSTDEIVKRFERREEDGAVEIVETIRLSALSGHESMVQVGRQARITVGVISTPGRGSTRQMESHNIGTLVSLTAEPADGKVLLRLSYSSSRFEGTGTDESPPDIVTFQSDATLLLEAGKPTLVGGSSASETSYLMVSVDQVRQIPGSRRTKSADSQP